MADKPTSKFAAQSCSATVEGKSGTLHHIVAAAIERAISIGEMIGSGPASALPPVKPPAAASSAVKPAPPKAPGM